MNTLSAAERQTLLRTGKLGLRLWCLWGRPAWDEPLWERLLTAFVYFLMGIVEVFGGLSGIYFSRAIVWLGYWHVTLTIKIEDWLGIKRDPDLSRRIVDPRHRLAALDAIEKSVEEARRRR